MCVPAPHYATSTQDTELRPTGGVQLATTSELYDRVHQLSEKIRTELGHLDNIESLSPSWPTPSLPEAGERGLEVASDFEGQRSTNSTLVESLDESASEDDDTDASERIGPSVDRMTSNSLAPDSSNDEMPRMSGGSSNHSGDNSSDPRTRYSQTDPKLQRAFQKMKKLDAKLADLSRVKPMSECLQILSSSLILFSFTHTEREGGEETEAVVGAGNGKCREDF